MFSVTYLQEDGISDQNCGQRNSMTLSLHTKCQRIKTM